jgi:hypothetical protein
VVKGNPVAFVSVADDGVPKAPPKITKAPAEPVATPKAVKTPDPVVMVDGAKPAPPPIISALAAKTDEDAQVELLEKYTTPPEVPATVSDGVVVAFATEINPPVKLTDDTVPV